MYTFCYTARSDIKLNTTIELSCPDCQKLILMDMFLDSKEDKLPQEVDAIFNMLIGNIVHYSFKGMIKCACGSIVVSCLTVSAQKG